MIPEDLRALPQWLAWRYGERNGNPTKIPISPHGGPGKSTNPATWGTYAQALGVVEANGIGFVFSPDDPYCGVDMDECVSASGRIHDAAHRVVAALNGYTEFSPSGRGLHIIVRARLDRGRHTMRTEWGDEIAFYSTGRYFTMSGEGRGTIREAQQAVTELISYYFPEEEHATPPRTRSQPFSGDDADVLDRIHADPRISALWHGDITHYHNDHSAADMALCAHLAFFCDGDPARTDAFFRRSGLMRDKWDQPRGDSTYGQQTLAKVLR